MLTKDLLRYRTVNGFAVPKFADPADPDALNLAAELLNLYKESLRMPHTALNDAAAEIVNRAWDVRFAKGLLKLIDDQSEFSGNSELDFPAERAELFRKASELLKNPDLKTWSCEEFRAKVFENREALENIYADLPDYEVLVKIPEFTPERLVERYNGSLAQSLVLYSKSLKLHIVEKNSAKMRRFFKFVRFFRLLVSVETSAKWSDGTPGDLKLTVDGPASILDGANKYGLQLASFLPAVFQLSEWKFQCVLEIDRVPIKFKLDHKSGITRNFGRFSIYIPEEIGMFAKLFRETVPDWEISSKCPFLRGRNRQNFIFPDMKFTSPEGETVYLELFHHWHASKLPDRLKFIAENPEIPLLLGIDRSLIKKDETTIRENPLYGKRIFLFRNFPGVENVRKLLKSFGKD